MAEAPLYLDEKQQLRTGYAGVENLTEPDKLLAN